MTAQERFEKALATFNKMLDSTSMPNFTVSQAIDMFELRGKSWEERAEAMEAEIAPIGGQ